MNIRFINIEQLPVSANESILRPAISDEFNYIAIAIECAGKHYYWANGISIEITQDEYAQICANPKIFYFSVALDLHHRIIRSKLTQPFGIDTQSQCIERIRLWTNTFAEKWRVIQTGRIYHKAYGHLKSEYQGRIDEETYTKLTKSNFQEKTK